MNTKLSKKYDNAVSLYETGMSIGDCAEFYEISRQAMHLILKRRNCKFRSNLKYGSGNHFHRGCLVDKTKQKRAGHIVEQAIKKGILIKPVFCEKCGNPQILKNGANGIQAHHCDYDKPLEVEWLCKKCHYEWHKINKV